MTGVGEKLSFGRQQMPPSRPAVSRLTDCDDAAAEDAEGEGQLSEAALQKRREENIRALVSNSLQTCRQPLMSKFLTVMEGEVTLRKPFQSPVQGAPRMSDALRRKLVARRHFVPWGSSTPLPIPTMSVKPLPSTPLVLELPPEPPPPPAPEPALPEGIEPLVLWQLAAVQPGAVGAADGEPSEVVVDPMLVRFLRPHQREGVQFMFDCVTGQRLEGRQGCILADDMGLGKTLQGISLMWTLLTGGHPALGGCPIARRAIIVCPTSLVSNWDNECTKWLQGRLKTLAMCESSREDVVANIGLFLHPSNVYKVLIISYETFRMHADRFQVPHACDLLLCDEAHRLKNDATLTNRALDNLPCKRRVLLSGTPMQNHLDEFFAMVDFCNPGVLGAPAQFRKHYELPILAGREPDASPEQVVLGEERSRELSGLTNNFILRRTNKLLSQHLPPKVIEVVCCRLTELQRLLYDHFLQSKAARRVLNGRTSGVLSAITSLKKLCNHPKLIYDAVHSKAAAAAAGDDGEGGGRAEGFEDVGSLFPPGLFDNGRVGRGGMAAGWEAVSGKMAVLARMLHVLYTETNDRIVLVSNYTSSLDLFAQLCRERGYPFVRLDGTTTINKRQKLVKVFNDPAERQFAFLLSSKAGGCGLNLIGANRLVLFDPDWNPANDQQAAARVWRDGQRKRVFVYRFLSTGSIEEKVYQRQLSKEGLKQLVSKNGKAAANVMTAEDLRELFTLNATSWSDTYDCMCGGPGLPEGAAEAAEAAGAGAGGSSPIDRGSSGSSSGSDDDDDGSGGGGGAVRRGGAGGAPAPSAAAAGAGGTDAGGGGGVGGEAGRLPPVHKKQSGEPAEEDLANWGHHPSPETVPDAVMRRVAAPDVSFIFSCSVAGKPIEGGDEEERRLADAAAAAAATGGGAAAAATVVRAGAGAGMRSSGRAPGGAAARVGVPRVIASVSTPAAAAPGGRGSGSGVRLGSSTPGGSSAAPPQRIGGSGGSGAATPGCRTPAALPPAAAAARPAAATPLTAPATSPPGVPASGPPRVAAHAAATAAAGAAAAASAGTNAATTGPSAAAATRPAAAAPLPPPPHSNVRQPLAGQSAAAIAAAAAATAAAVGQPRQPPTAPTTTTTANATSGRGPSPATSPTSGSSSGPQSQPQPQRHAQPPAAASSGGGGGGRPPPPSSVTGALLSAPAPQGRPGGANGRVSPGAAAPPAAGGGGGSAKPAPLAAAAAAAAGQVKAPAAVGPTQHLRGSAGTNSQQQQQQPKPVAQSGQAAAAGPAAAPGAGSRLSAPTKAAAAPNLGGVAARPHPPPQTKAPAAAAAAAAAAGPAGGSTGVRGRTAMEAGGGAVLEPPQPKRRAPGWYIDDDDDFL
ncbi:DNA-dependent ATPase protein rad54 [Pleodorina starrii]|nr:DNA-dependent ATPase protein rad54 [Pleodorina starrii]